MQGSERQRRLRRDPSRGQNADGGPLLVRLDARDQVREERRLPHARITKNRQDRRLARTRRGDERGQARTLDIPSVEHPANLPCAET